jgi:hypothetical protein
MLVENNRQNINYEPHGGGMVRRLSNFLNLSYQNGHRFFNIDFLKIYFLYIQHIVKRKELIANK